MNTDGLCLEGDIDDLAIGHLHRALDILPKGMPAVVDVARARARDGAVRTELQQLAAAGVVLTY